MKKGVLEISENSDLTYNFIKKETLAQVFSYEFCEISKNTFLTKHLWTTASFPMNPLKYLFLWVMK